MDPPAASPQCAPASGASDCVRRVPGRPCRCGIASEILKTRLAHGYCSRHLSAGACPYANVCETYDNFVPGPEHLPILREQLGDIRLLRDDAEQRGWTDETQRHHRMIEALETHCQRLTADPR